MAAFDPFKHYSHTVAGLVWPASRPEPSSASTRQWILADSTCASRTGEGTIKYNVVLSVSNPGLDAGPRDEFLSKFWYLAQRRGLRLDPSPGPDAATRLGMLEQGGAVRRDAGALPQLAQASVFRRYRRGDVLLRAGASAPDVFFVVAGHLAVTIPTGEGEIRLELVRSWELMVLQEMLAGGSSPVRVVAELDSDVLGMALR